MAKMGRPKVPDACKHIVAVKLNDAEYDFLVEYMERHNLTISQVLRYGIQLQLEQEKSQKK